MAPVALETIEAIRRKKSMYCQAVDAKKFDMLDDVALPDAILQYKNPDGTFVTAALEGQDKSIEYSFKGVTEFKAFFKRTFETLQTIHICDAGFFDQISEDEVKAVFVVMYNAGPLGSKSEGHGSGGGHYHEVYKRVDGDWFLKSVDFVLLHQKM